MRSEWVPMSAAALITGAMSLVLAQVLNPSGSNRSPMQVLDIAAENSGRWLTMSVLFFVASVFLVLGLPSVLTLFTERGRRLGLTGVAVFALGSIGLAGFSALMVMLRAMALAEALQPERLGVMLADTALELMVGLWFYGFLGGVLLIALALLRARRAPVWVSGLLLGFLLLQPFAPAGGKVVSAVALILLAAGFTGIATTAASPDQRPRAFRP